jgi:hypothetical protein
VPQNPPAWTPSDGEIGQVPIAVTQDVDTTGVPADQNAHALAEQIVRDNQPAISRFVKNQRQQIEIGHETVRRAVLPLDKMDVYYQYVAPFERMHYHISPEVETPVAPEEMPPELEAPAIPEIPAPPAVPEIETPEPPPVPEVPEEKLPEVPEAKPPELAEPEEEEEKKEFGKPDFIEVDTAFGLAVEFGDKDGDPP